MYNMYIRCISFIHNEVHQFPVEILAPNHAGFTSPESPATSTSSLGQLGFVHFFCFFLGEMMSFSRDDINGFNQKRMDLVHGDIRNNQQLWVMAGWCIGWISCVTSAKSSQVFSHPWTRKMGVQLPERLVRPLTNRETCKVGFVELGEMGFTMTN